MYQLTLDSSIIKRLSDGACIPADPANLDYADYLAWRDQGNAPAPAQTLGHARAQRWEEIKAMRDHLSDAGGYKVAVAGVDKWFHSDAKSKTQQLGLFIMGAAVPAVQWKTMDGSFVAMSQALAAQIFQAAAAQDQAIFAVAEQHKAAMEAAEEPEAYDFTAGWPATYPGPA
jgi:hypothetical protein